MDLPRREDATVDPEFEAAYDAFVRAGGLDAVRAVSEDYERMARARVDRARKCMHGLTPMLCKRCSDWS